MYCGANSDAMLLGMKNDALEEKVFAVFRDRLLTARGAASQSDVSGYFAEHGWELKQAALSHYENGKRRPNFSMLIKFATVYGTSTDYLLGVTKKTESFEELEKKLAEATGGGPIHKALQALPKPKQQQVLQFAEYLLSQEPGARKVPAISPPPLTEDQRLEAAINIILNSVEEKYGIDARRDMERRIRDELRGGDAAK